MDDRDVVAWLKSDPEDDANPETYRRIAQQLRLQKRNWVPWASAAAIVIVGGSMLLMLRRPQTQSLTQSQSLVTQLE